ncbi:MAG TPA: PEGA domain-containing protein, partial [Candidatus Norongarragalinales archaeon]|nr:PEGA domain-containing protein [Candidatus Norongarragalinales archaeon]
SEGGTNLVDVHYASGHAFDAFLNESNIFRDSINFLEFKASGASPNGVWITISKMNRQGIRVDSNPPLANVYLDGFFKGISPLFIAGASLGAHQVKLTKPEYSDYSQNVVVSSGLTTYVNASMTAFPATLFVNSTPINASVSLFSESKGYTPILISNLTPRNYWIIVRKSGYQDWQKNVDLSPGQYLAEHAILVPRSVSPTPTSSPTPTPKGAIRGITTPTGASMRVDAISKGLTPLTITNLSVGSHSVGFTKTGYLPYSTTVPVVASATATVSAVLVPTPTPTATPTSIPTATPTATPSTGSIFASSNPALANLYINFQIRGLTPITVSNLTPGPATVQMSKQGYQTFQSVVDVIAGRTINVSANLTPTAAPTSSPTATITATPSVNATPTPSINATITPTPSVNATPSPYGSITPTPNATSTPTPIPPTNTQPPGGGYTGGNGGFPEPTSRAGATPAASSIPSLTPPPKGSYEEILTEVDELMEALPDRPDILEETGKYLETAQALEKAGRKEESVNLLEKAKVRLLSAIAESKTTKATFSWQFALIAIAVVASLAILHFVHIGVIEKKL